MSELKIESTNGGSTVSFVGGQMAIDEKENDINVPPRNNTKISCSKNPEDYITLKLIDNVKEQNEQQEK